MVVIKFILVSILNSSSIWIQGNECAGLWQALAEIPVGRGTFPPRPAGLHASLMDLRRFFKKPSRASMEAAVNTHWWNSQRKHLVTVRAAEWQRAGGMWGCWDTHPFGGQVFHTPSHLVSTRQQVLEGQLLLRHLGHIKGVVHARGSACPQELPKAALGGIFHQDIKGACADSIATITHTTGDTSAKSEAKNPVGVNTASKALRVLTILGTYAQQVNDVLVLVHPLHQLHLGDQVRKVFVSGVI